MLGAGGPHRFDCYSFNTIKDISNDGVEALKGVACQFRTKGPKVLAIMAP